MKANSLRLKCTLQPYKNSRSTVCVWDGMRRIWDLGCVNILWVCRRSQVNVSGGRVVLSAMKENIVSVLFKI